MFSTSEMISIRDIVVKRDDRQRRKLEGIEELAASIRLRGLINPIVINKDNELVAGERRLEAVKSLGFRQIEVRRAETLDPNELQIIELEENIKRVDLSWQDRALSVYKVHQAYVALDSSWTYESTGDALGLDKTNISRDISLALEINDGNELVIGASKRSEALTNMKRAQNRAVEAVTNALFDETPKAQSETSVTRPAPLSPETGREIQELTEAAKTPLILQADFLQWSARPQPQKFNFIHCDFPYGVGLQKSGQISSATARYEDDPEVYWNLLEAFVKNFSNFASPMSHVMFWYSMKFHTETVEALLEIPNSRLCYFPLIWHKSDGKGIAPDALREPRRIYETALVLSTGDRNLRKMKSNLFSGPTEANRAHPSMKSRAMLGYFFEMFVDDETRLLDPTCGSGSALEAGRKLGASVLGLEIDPELAGDI